MSNTCSWVFRFIGREDEFHIIWPRIEGKSLYARYQEKKWTVDRKWCIELIQLKLAVTIKGCLDNQIIEPAALMQSIPDDPPISRPL